MGQEPEKVVLNWLFNVTIFLKQYHTHAFSVTHTNEELILRSARTPVDNPFFKIKKYFPHICFQCTMCGKQSSYYEHIHSHFINECYFVDIRIPCPYCCSTFISADELVGHILNHLRNDTNLIRLLNEKPLSQIDKYLDY